MKLFLLSANENWICDRFVYEWCQTKYDTITRNPNDADILWLVAGWCWKHIPMNLLKNKKVVITIHHIVPDKFNENERHEFSMRDNIIDYYHVPCQKTKEQLLTLTKKPIYVMPFWVNQHIWKSYNDLNCNLRKRYNIDKDCFLIGSFQRDTEGHDLISPKLEKGPDQFCDAVKQIYDVKKTQNNKEVKVMLAGWRREYVMNRLKEDGITYYYNELPTFNVLNNLYNMLDLYIVASRFEGGPQAIVECASNKTPIVSTDVGLASLILHNDSIFESGNILDCKPNIDVAYENVQKYWMSHGFNNFIKMFEEIYN